MRRKIWIAVASVSALLLGILVWRLDIPNWKKLDLEKIYAQPKSTVIYDASGEAVSALASAEKRIWTPINRIPEQVRQAFIAAEDQRFYEHKGINLRRIFAAALTNLRSGSYAQGASTITQQLIKLTHLSEEKTLSRKAQEAVRALQLERRLTKDEILECYLNTIYFGRGAYGIASAAKTYFSKDVSELSLSESALLAGVIKAPSNYAPHLNPEKSVQRRNLVLQEMADCGFITRLQAETAGRETLQLALAESETELYGWFKDAALEEAAEILNLTTDTILSSGYAIHTSFDPYLQAAADALFSDDTNFPIGASDGTPVQAAMVVMHPDTGEICAMVGGRSYEVQRGLNRATQIRRSPGSAIKPVSAYAAAIDAYGFAPTSLVEDTPREFDGGYTPRNAGGSSYGTVTLREALSRSLNIATVDLADLIGVNAVRNYAARFGLPLAWQDDNLALSLGSMTYGVSPAELCAAYAALANGGTKIEPHIIRRIENADSQVVYSAPQTASKAVQPSTAYMLTDMLKTAAASGSAKALSSAGLPVAGKTGTVSAPDGSTRDIWTAAYTPDLAVTVWMGYDAPDADHCLASSEGGSGYPAKLCASFLKKAAARLSGADFTRPESVRIALLDSLALEENAVLLATEKTPQEYIVAELFHPDNIPKEYSDHWTAPTAISDLTLLSRAGEVPILQFTAQSSDAEYLVLRTTGDRTETIAVLTGNSGETLRFADPEADLTARCVYRILPRHRLLNQSGELLTGKESAAVAYSPGGILDLFYGSESPQEMPDIEVNETQSLFG